jgi:uncharacterized protein YhfF
MYSDQIGELPDADDLARYGREQFGDTPELADMLARLIVAGVKTATCSALWEYEADGEPLPTLGKRTIVLDGRNVPLCVIEITEVKVHNFRDVDAQFAYDEGEGDRSLPYWRQEHWKFFTRSLRRIGREPRNDMPLVCKRFRVIHTY